MPARELGEPTPWERLHASDRLVALFLRSTGNSAAPFAEPPPGSTRRILPPTFLSALRAEPDELGIPSDQATRLNAGNSFEWFVPVEPGAELERQSRVTSTYEKDGRSGLLRFYEFESVYRLAGDERLIGRSRGTTIRRYDR